ncbi:MAG: hypothetical protein M3Y22_12220, partial [Pseudomonadota bacterium]|nr:hypothetical protein [Pseudomonadota bacterium]
MATIFGKRRRGSIAPAGRSTLFRRGAAREAGGVPARVAAASIPKATAIISSGTAATIAHRAAAAPPVTTGQGAHLNA